MSDWWAQIVEGEVKSVEGGGLESVPRRETAYTKRAEES